MGDERLRVRTDVIRKDAIVEMSEKFLERQVIYNKDEVYGVKSKKIGIINPYVLMKVVSRKKKFFIAPRFRNDMIDVINTYTAAANMGRVNETNLFAPDSVLFQPLVSAQIVKRCADMTMMKPVTMSSVVIPHTMAFAVTDTGVSTGAAGAPNPYPYGNANKMGTAKTSTGADAPATVPTSRDRKEIIGDVIQGACLDCWFMAALYSWVWCRKITPVLTPTNGIYKIIFNSYDYNSAKWTPKDIFVKPALPLNASSQLVFAQQTPLDFEIWPALYEKAYGEYLNLPSFTIPGATQKNPPNPYDPDTGQFQQGDPLIALINISGYLPTERANNSANNPTVYKTNGLVNNTYKGTTAFDVLRLCNNSSSSTLWPTVAWTYASGSGGFPSTNWPVNPVLAPSHSYSILGRYEDTASTDPAKKYYIVLRNPWGLPVTKDSAPAVFKNSLASVIWKPDNVLAPLNLNLGNNPHGIFGLENSAFEKYFEGFGWSQFRSVTPP
jgi:hypothetical protein